MSVSLLHDDDLYLFNEGTHLRLYDKLGVHRLAVDGVDAEGRGTADAPWRTVQYAADRALPGDRVLLRLLDVPAVDPRKLQAVVANELADDLPWEMESQAEEVRLRLQTPHGWVSLIVHSPCGLLQPLVVRAGEPLAGSLPAQPTWGWTAPTYGTKIPALSFSITLEAPAPLILISQWTLPTE